MLLFPILTVCNRLEKDFTPVIKLTRFSFLSLCLYSSSSIFLLVVAVSMARGLVLLTALHGESGQRFYFPQACLRRYKSLHAVCSVFPYEVLHFLATSFPGKTVYPVCTINNTVLTPKTRKTLKAWTWDLIKVPRLV